MRTPKALALLFALLFAQAFPQPAVAQEAEDNLPPGLNADAALLARLSGLFQAEDPTSLYQLDVYDENVEFILDGSWTAALSGSVEFIGEKGVTAIAYAPPVLNQSVDLSTWIFIARSWYFEADFAEEFTKNTLAFGFVGSGDFPVRHARIGNSGIAFPTEYPFVSLGGADRESLSPVIAPGAMASFAGNKWNADAMVRYDAAAARNLLLSGMNEAADRSVSVDSPVRGTFFVLPDENVSGSVILWAEDAQGSEFGGGRRWRRLKNEEFTVDGLTGIVTLDNPAKRALAVFYPGSWTDGSGGAGSSLLQFLSDTSDWIVSRGSDPGDLGADRFLLSVNGVNALLLREPGLFSPFEFLSRYELSGDDIRVVHGESGALARFAAAEGLPDGRAQLYPDGLSPASSFRSPELRFPLMDRFPGIYLPPFALDKGQTDLELRSRTYTPLAEINLGTEAIPGTVQVYRNGVEERDFSLDPQTGILTLIREPGLSDSIRITWYDADPGSRNQSLAAAAGLSLRPLEGLTLSGAASLRWNLAQEGYTDADTPSPGTVLASAGAEYRRGALSLSSASAVELAVADTTGMYRVFGMDARSSSLEPASSWYRLSRPALPPVLGPPASDQSPSPVLLGDNRGNLTSERNAETGDTVLSLTGNLEASGDWAAADILTGEMGNQDLRNLSRIALNLRNPGGTNAYDLYLQGGVADGEYPESDGAVATWLVARAGEIPGGTQWKSFRVDVGPEDRARLGGYQNLRLVAVYSGVLPCQVNLESGPILLSENLFSVEGEPELETGWALTVPETSGAAVEALSLHNRDAVERLNPGRGNSVARVSFAPNASAASQRIVLSRFLGAVPLESYETIAFEFELDALPQALSGSRIDLVLYSPDGDGNRFEALRVSVPADSGLLVPGAWVTVKADLSAASVTLNGEYAPATSLVFEKGAGAPTALAIELIDWGQPSENSAGDAGRTEWVLRLDEVRMEGSVQTRRFLNESSLAWSKKGPFVSLGGFTLVDSPSFRVSSSASASMDGGDSSLGLSAEGSLALTVLEISGALTLSAEPRPVLETESHSLRLPLGALTLGEDFNVDLDGKNLSRDETLALSGPVPAKVSAGLDLEGSFLSRKAALSISPTLPLGKMGSLAAGLDLTAQQRGRSPYEGETLPSWDSLWGSSILLLGSPGEADALRRGISASSTLAWLSAPGEGGFLKSVNAAARASEGYTLLPASRSQRVSLGEFSLASPFSLSESLVTPSWRRSVQRSRYSAEGGSWGEDAEAFGASLSASPWLWESAPVWDLVSDAPSGSEDRESEFTYKTEYGLSWDRPALGSLSDLWVPVSVTGEIARLTVAQAMADNLRDTRRASLRAAFSALNMAGRWGVRPLFDWYDQDEISQMYGVNAQWGSDYATWGADAWTGVALYYGESGTASLDNQLTYVSPGIDGTGERFGGSLRLLWKRPVEGSPLEEVVSRFTELPVTSRREDSLSLRWESLGAAALSLAWKHDLVAEIGKNGEIRISAGPSWEGTEDRSVASLTLSVGGTLRY